MQTKVSRELYLFVKLHNFSKLYSDSVLRLRSLFGYLENFRPREFRSLVSYKFPKRNSVDLLRITSRRRGEREEKNLLWIFFVRRNFCAPQPQGRQRGWKRTVYLTEEVFACMREGNILSIKPQLRAVREHPASDSPSSSSSLRSISFIKRAFNINQLPLYRQRNL